jgi:hypothetical protein
MSMPRCQSIAQHAAQFQSSVAEGIGGAFVYRALACHTCMSTCMYACTYASKDGWMDAKLLLACAQIQSHPPLPDWLWKSPRNTSPSNANKRDSNPSSDSTLENNLHLCNDSKMYDLRKAGFANTTFECLGGLFGDTPYWPNLHSTLNDNAQTKTNNIPDMLCWTVLKVSTLDFYCIFIALAQRGFSER